MIKKLKCIDNRDYEQCLTIGKVYDVEIEELGNGSSMKKLKDNNGEFLQTMVERFEEI